MPRGILISGTHTSHGVPTQFDSSHRIYFPARIPLHHLHRNNKIITNTMSRYQITSLNNNGVACLRMGNTRDACTILTKASSILGQMNDNGSSRPSASSFSWLDLSTEPLFLSSFAEQKLPCESSLPFMFLRALRITPTEDDDACPADLFWAVLYNLAISCQLMACQLGQKGNQHLRKAHELYEIVRSRFLVITPVEYRATVALAVFNNAGCIYKDVGMHEQSAACLHQVQEIMVTYFPKTQIQGKALLFGINLRLLQGPINAAAA